MKTVSQAFMDAWVAKQGKQALLTIKYKRRYWNEGTLSYQYEAAFTQLTMRQFVEVGSVTNKLDTPLLNEVKTSNLILKFKNSDYQMLPSNASSGFFGPDAAHQAVQPAQPLPG